MLINRYLRTVIYTPMKCGSTSIHNMLASTTWHTVIGPHPWNFEELDKHTHCVPYWGRHFKKLLLIRNPMTRILSLYHHWRIYNKNFAKYMTFEKWWKFMEEEGYVENCVKLYPRYDGIIRLESLESDLKSRGISVAAVLHSNQSERKTKIPSHLVEPLMDKYRPDIVAGQYESLRKPGDKKWLT